MKKFSAIGILLAFVILFCFPVMGSPAGYSHDKYTRKNYITFSWFLKPASLGLKVRLIDNFYAATNLDYERQTNDMEFQAGGVYLIPRKILIFNFYAGGGYQFSRNQGSQFPYLAVGTNFLFLYSEVVYPMKANLDPKYRFGLSFRF